MCQSDGGEFATCRAFGLVELLTISQGVVDRLKATGPIDKSGVE